VIGGLCRGMCSNDYTLVYVAFTTHFTSTQVVVRRLDFSTEQL